MVATDGMTAPAPFRPTPWRCWPRAGVRTPRRRPGAPPAPWCCQDRQGTQADRGDVPGASPAAGQGSLHGLCFYMGRCDPLEETERRTRQATGYIDEAVRLARS